MRFLINAHPNAHLGSTVIAAILTITVLDFLQVGTYQTAVMAKALNKPFYVLAESFKFVRLYPLKQSDIRNVEKVS